MDIEYMTTKQAAEKWDMSVRQVQFACEGGRVGSAIRAGNIWLIHKDAPKPVDGRTKAAKVASGNLKQDKNELKSHSILQGGNPMDCTLMHKNIPVLDMQIDEETGYVAKLNDVYNINHLPLGIIVFKTRVDRKALNDWWTGRSIPASRDGIRDALETLGVYSTALLLSKCYGLSLSDQYWIRPKDSNLTWEKVNFFQNDFTLDIGEILFGREPADPHNISLMSPDNTSDGWLKKKWIIVDGKRVLMKGGSGVFKQEPFNEVIASAVMRRLNIPHIDYTLTFDGGKPYSLCENFITPDTDLVPAWRVRESIKQDNRDSNYTHLLRCCDAFGIPGVRAALDKMLVLDYIILNEDRHYNNFGFIRNAETLQWLGCAPVFDSGTSLWYNTQRVGSSTESKPFRKSHAEQIKLVEDLSWFDAGALDGIEDEINEILSKSEDVDENRRERIASAVKERCRQIETLAKEKPSLMKRVQDNQSKVDAQTPENKTGKKKEAEIGSE